MKGKEIDGGELEERYCSGHARRKTASGVPFSQGSVAKGHQQEAGREISEVVLRF